ncbi:MAG TPA: RDD family protein [Candidatus Saccharimonadales bacterium]|nr:RDD family protein [Candidatus Saccharimonadales bacterium]
MNLHLQGDRRVRVNPGAASAEENTQWRGELAERLEAYRSRRKKGAPSTAQSQLPFEEAAPRKSSRAPVAVAEAPGPEDDFSFTIAIGRPAKKKEFENSRMEIDVSHPCEPWTPDGPEILVEAPAERQGLYPTASIEERRLAGMVDAFCLLFAYGGFLLLFGSLGGEFTLSKLSAAVYTATFAFVYLQYFALFTVFGGTTPGMMMRGLQVASFSGDSPSPRQLLLRSTGYMLSAGTFFLGYLWSVWDEDSLTWHDRLSRTYLTSAQTLADIDATSAAPTR